MQNVKHKSTKILCVGSSGTGKTQCLTRYVKNADYFRTYVFDHEGELADRWKIPATLSIDDLPRVNSEQQIVIYDPSEDFPSNFEEAFCAFSEWVFEISKEIPQPKLFVCDEIQKMTGPWKCPDELKAILQTGRRRTLDAFLISQAPNEIHNTIRNQTTDIFAFRLIDENSLRFIDDLKMDVDFVRGLKDGECLYRDNVTGECFALRIF